MLYEDVCKIMHVIHAITFYYQTAHLFSLVFRFFWSTQWRKEYRVAVHQVV